MFLCRRGAFRAHEDFVGEGGLNYAVVVVFDNGVGVGVYFGTGLEAALHGNGCLHIEKVLCFGHGDVYAAL